MSCSMFGRYDATVFHWVGRLLAILCCFFMSSSFVSRRKRFSSGIDSKISPSDITPTSHALNSTPRAQATCKMARLNDRLEEKYVLKKIEGLADGELKGCGAYGIVRVVSVRGTRCIAKRIHDILKDPRVPPADRDSVKQKFHKECKMLSQLRHPNIVHFVGVHYDRRGDMSLIMEALDSDLRGFFVQREPSISVKLSILLDVSYGLLYLHTQHPTPIIHRDLNPGNILLTRDMKAKIADLGVSSYLSFAKAQTMAPGAWGYMPPEALRENPVYDTSLDVFSFGHIALCVGSHKSLSVVIPPSRVVQQTPIKQRKRYLDALGSRHCLYSVAVDCLHNQPRRRPSTRELCDTLQWLNSAHTVECVVGGSTDVLGEKVSKPIVCGVRLGLLCKGFYSVIISKYICYIIECSKW